MIIHEETSKEPLMVSMNGMPAQAMRQALTTHKLRNDKDFVGFTKEMAKGRDIILVSPGDPTYVILREWIPSKIALGGLPGERKQ